MAVSVITRPYGFVFQDVRQGVAGERVTASGSKAFVELDSPHGMSDPRTIYFKSSVENYNGILRIEVADALRFYLCENREDALVRLPFIKEIDGTEFQFTIADSLHTWNCVHLPIVYKLSNDVWPTNSVTSIRDILTAADFNGYTRLTFSSSLNVTQELEKVKITGCTDESLNGIWTVLVHTSNTDFVIDIPYTSAGDTDLTNNGGAQLYFDNYLVKVQVWGGLINSHEYYGQKPYELLATIDLIPDENNICKFSVSDILKKHIELENNLLLGTLPNNLDAWTGFFIKFGEEFDISDGEELSRSTVTYTSDLNNFQGRAVNAMMPFKNVYSGAMSEYASADEEQKFLTNFERPVIFEGKYFDLSFIWEGVTTFFIRQQFYLNNVLQATQYTEALEAFYTGVYRQQIEDNCDYDRVDVTAYHTTGVPAPSAWSNSSGLTAYSSKTATQLILTAGSGSNQYGAYTPLSAVNGDTVTINLVVVVTGTWTGIFSLTGLLTNNADSGVGSDGTQDITANGTYNIEFVIPVTVSSPVVQRLHILLTTLGVTGSVNVAITLNNYVQISSVNTVISETKTIDINCDCIPTQSEEGIYLSWLNNLGGFDYWLFTANKDHIIDVTETGETEENIFSEWPNSYGEFADTIRKETYRDSRKQALVRSQNLSADQLEVLKAIKSSPLVQIVNSIYDRRTVIVDADSFTWKKEGQAQIEPYKISFIITYTDNIPSQRA